MSTRVSRSLVARWRTEAKSLRYRGASPQAELLESCASDLEQLLEEWGREALTLGEAAKLSGYSAEHLGRLIRDGKIPNAGRLGAPRITCGDLPRKPDVAADTETGHISSKQIVRSAINEGAG